MSQDTYAPPMSPVVASAKTFADANPVVLWTVTGRVAIYGIVGIVTTLVGAVATTIKLYSNPTIGADTDFCAATAITNEAAGTCLGLTQVAADPIAIGANEGSTIFGPTPRMCAAGTIETVATGGTAGAIDWYIIWAPLSVGSKVV